jgi:hypothetical protein
VSLNVNTIPCTSHLRSMSVNYEIQSCSTQWHTFRTSCTVLQRLLIYADDPEVHTVQSHRAFLKDQTVLKKVTGVSSLMYLNMFELKSLFWWGFLSLIGHTHWKCFCGFKDSSNIQNTLYKGQCSPTLLCTLVAGVSICLVYVADFCA